MATVERRPKNRGCLSYQFEATEVRIVEQSSIMVNIKIVNCCCRYMRRPVGAKRGIGHACSPSGGTEREVLRKKPALREKRERRCGIVSDRRLLPNDDGLICFTCVLRHPHLHTEQVLMAADAQAVAPKRYAHQHRLSDPGESRFPHAINRAARREPGW
jgi:hypothetical protein